MNPATFNLSAVCVCVQQTHRPKANNREMRRGCKMVVFLLFLYRIFRGFLFVCLSVYLILVNVIFKEHFQGISLNLTEMSIWTQVKLIRF